MPDGFRSLVTFASNPSIQLWERQIKPPGIDGGEGIDTTTMHNVAWRTRQPRKLKTLDPSTFMAAYDPDVIPSLYGQINRQDTITFTFPDGSTLCFFGFLQKFEPGELREGEFPDATCTFVPTNQDLTTGVEQAPVFTPAAGT